MYWDLHDTADEEPFCGYMVGNGADDDGRQNRDHIVGCHQVIRTMSNRLEFLDRFYREHPQAPNEPHHIGRLGWGVSRLGLDVMRPAPNGNSPMLTPLDNPIPN